EFSYFFRVISPELSGFFVDWIMAAFGEMLARIEAIRRCAGNIPVEFALAPEVSVIGTDALLGQYRARNLRVPFSGTIPIGIHPFPIASIAGRDEFSELLRRFDQDVWHLAGKDFPQEKNRFELVSE